MNNVSRVAVPCATEEVRSFADDIIARSIESAIDKSQRWPAITEKDGDKRLPQSVGVVLLTLLGIAKCSASVKPSWPRRSQKSYQVVIIDRMKIENKEKHHSCTKNIITQKKNKSTSCKYKGGT